MNKEEKEAVLAEIIECELGNLSERTLKLYASETAQAVQKGRNPAVERYDNLWRRLDEGSLATYENKLAAQR